MRGIQAAFAVALVLMFVPVLGLASDLMEVITAALDHDSTLAGARSEVQIGQLGVPLARAALLPRAEAGWNRAYNRIAVDGAPPIRYWQNGWTVTLTQPLFDWQRWADLKLAGTAKARSGLEYASAWQALILRAANAFFEVLAATDEVSRATDYLDAVSAQHALVTRQFAAGEATLIDVREAEAQLDAARLQQLDARQMLDSQRRAVEALTGRPFIVPAPVTDHLPGLKPEPDDAEHWVRQAQAKSYPVQIGELDVRQADDEVEKARALGYPVVNLTSSHSPTGAASGISDPTTRTTTSLSVSLPLFAGGEIRTSLRRALAGEDKAQSRLLAATRQAGADTRETFRRLNWARERSERLARLVQANEETLAATQIGYKAGSRTNLDVLRAYDSLYAVRKERLRAHYDMLSAFLALKAGVAALDLGDIVQLNAWLTPMAPAGSALP